MGQIVKYSCKECGYESANIYEGVGFGGYEVDDGFMQRRLERIELAKIIEREEHGGKLIYKVPSFSYDDSSEGAQLIFRELCEKGLCPKCRAKGTIIKHGIGLWD